MKNKSEFCAELAKIELSHVERAIALLWYYRQTQDFEERSGGELAQDLHDEGFPKPNVTRLNADLKKNRSVVRGKRQGTYQISIQKIEDLDKKYQSILDIRRVTVHSSVLPKETFAGTRQYLEQMVYQINGAYESGFFDACAVLCRRLMESLIIEVYIFEKRKSEIQQNGTFFTLEPLINYITNDNSLTLGRNTPKTMKKVKEVGDTAAHDRVYITRQEDIDDLKASYRRMISDLVALTNIKK